MHNTSSGLLKHLLDLTETVLRNSSQHEDIQERLKLVPSFMELHRLAKRLAAKDITAAQRHSLGACMPVCLVGLVDMEPYIAAFTRRAAQQCLRPACMTAASSQLTTTSHVCGRLGQQRPHRPSSRYISAWYCHVVGLAQACLHAVWIADCLHPRAASRCLTYKRTQALDVPPTKPMLMQLCWSGWTFWTCGCTHRPAWTPFVRQG